MSKIRVGIIRGGEGPLYAESIKTGKIILDNLDNDLYTPVDIFIDRDGIWHKSGLPVKADKISSTVDVVINALHGAGGDDGTLSRLFRDFGVPTTGADVLGGAIVSNKNLLKERLLVLGIMTPKSVFIKHEEIADIDSDHIYNFANTVFKKIAPPWIVKPVYGGYGVHTYTAYTFKELLSTLSYFKKLRVDLLVEEYIKGDTVSFGSIQGFRGTENYNLLPLSIKREKGMWHYDHWHQDHYEPVHPKSISPIHREQIDEINKMIKDNINPGDYYTVNAKITNRGVFVLGVQNQPVLHEHSPFRKKLESVGASIKEFVGHLVEYKMGK